MSKRLAAGVERIGHFIAARRHWKKFDLGAVAIEVPSDWGNVEVTPGGYVVHNRAACARVDGDAVWYSSAIELHIGSALQRPHQANAAFAYRHRVFASASGPVRLTLAIARGVGRAQRKIAFQVLERADARSGLDLFCKDALTAPATDLAPLTHDRVAVIHSLPIKVNPLPGAARP
ncbi:hypothetical protein NKI77_07600 [Mesorhizobium opportunistum]|uniref:Uncharacterized protein n=1 Tax=Mesorhizobium opportunistum TaxID=593909 RepID=A0ABV1YBS7_9HYPH|nr:hypothetical protein [Mesorhizobium sp.]TIN94316.1 MAG: hypothetical protein E5Y06_16345 [Mesorhizobium sp.]TJU96072.1 MAG: hypothetical protein E5Y08_23235 [Mesorhizobium sp.]TJV16336.1 MAG: hypothetical protein E5Y07_18205 [Mesorhizobium sp.]